MEVFVAKIIQFGGASFILVSVIGIISSAFQFAFKYMSFIDVLRVILHFTFIPIGSLMYTSQIEKNYNYTSIKGMTALFVGFCFLLIGCSGLIIGSTEMVNFIDIDRYSLIGRLFIYTISLVLGFVIIPLKFNEI